MEKHRKICKARESHGNQNFARFVSVNRWYYLHVSHFSHLSRLHWLEYVDRNLRLLIIHRTLLNLFLYIICTIDTLYFARKRDSPRSIFDWQSIPSAPPSQPWLVYCFFEFNRRSQLNFKLFQVVHIEETLYWRNFELSRRQVFSERSYAINHCSLNYIIGHIYTIIL